MLQKCFAFQKSANNFTRSWFDGSDTVETLDEIGADHERMKTRSSRACRGIALSHFGQLRACPELIEGTCLSKGILRLFQN